MLSEIENSPSLVGSISPSGADMQFQKPVFFHKTLQSGDRNEQMTKIKITSNNDQNHAQKSQANWIKGKRN